MLSRRVLIVVGVAAGLWLVAAHGMPADLGSCATRYGELTVQHWLTVDTLRQIERLLFYRNEMEGDSKRGQRFRELQAAADEVERALNRAYDQYGALFQAKSAAGADSLNEQLARIAGEELRIQRDSQRMLSDSGRDAAGDAFIATPVKDDQLRPAADTSALIDEKFRPKRILFGSTGHVGDDRILPLKFDFGSGVYSFYVPMAGRDELQVKKPTDGWTDDVHRWMHAHGMGHHYWAGVYNNQKTYVADWFVKEFGNDEDVWLRTMDGKELRSDKGGFGQPNIWNANVRDYIRNYCETQAHYFHDDPTLVCYDYTGEPHPYAMNPPGQPQYSGYNVTAVDAFRDCLKRKFATIEALNRAWNTSYKSFASIDPPADPYVKLPEKATPLSYEFERFRCQSQTDYWKLVYDAYRKYDARKPIEAHASMYMSGWPAQAMDAYQMLREGVADWIDMHQNNFSPNLPEQIYLYSLCRLTGRTPVEFEYIWTFPRTGAFDEKSESDFRATCAASVWRNLVWGKRVLVFFDFYYEWPGYRNGLFDKDRGYSILRSSACTIPAIKRQALRFSDILLNTEIERPPIVVLQPSASVWNSPPIHPHDGFSFHTGAAMRIHELLFPRNYPFLYVPEEAVLEDGYELSQHRVIVLPQGPYQRERMTDVLLEWVRNGGTLICSGVPGIWTPYGEDDRRLIEQVFGKSDVADTAHGNWQWKWRLVERRPGAESIRVDNNGEVMYARARFGKGELLVATNGFETSEQRAEFYSTVDRAIGARPAVCTHDGFELTIRSGNRGRFLCVLNPDTRTTRDETVTLAGSFRKCTDLGVGSGVPVPVDVRGGKTELHLRLHPGESTVIELKP